jgi:hypothetical protein
MKKPSILKVRKILYVIVAVDAADGNTCELFDIGDDGSERVAVVGLPCSALACSTNARFWAR